MMDVNAYLSKPMLSLKRKEDVNLNVHKNCYLVSLFVEFTKQSYTLTIILPVLCVYVNGHVIKIMTNIMWVVLINFEEFLIFI